MQLSVFSNNHFRSTNIKSQISAGLFILTFLILAMSHPAVAQPPDTLWTKTFGESSSDYGLSVQQASDGGYIIVGRTESFGAGMDDVWLIRLEGENPTISGDITYPGHESNYPDGKIFINVWENPDAWPYPGGSIPDFEYVLYPPIDFNNPQPYEIEIQDPTPTALYYIAAFFDEDSTVYPQQPEAEA